MTLSAQRNDIESHTNALANFMPDGILFEAKSINDSNFRKLLRGFAGELFTAEGYIKTFDEEYSPLNTVLFIEEWERAVGIPDDCFNVEMDINDRRSNVLTKLASLGIQTVADYVALGLVFGKVLVVEQLDVMASPPIPVVLPDARFVIVITGVGITAAVPPYDVPFLLESGETTLECLFNKLKPSNCSIIFVNS